MLELAVLQLLSLSEPQLHICKVGTVTPSFVGWPEGHIFFEDGIWCIQLGVQLFPPCPVLPTPYCQTSQEVLASPVQWAYVIVPRCVTLGTSLSLSGPHSIHL